MSSNVHKFASEEASNHISNLRNVFGEDYESTHLQNLYSAIPVDQLRSFAKVAVELHSEFWRGIYIGLPATLVAAPVVGKFLTGEWMGAVVAAAGTGLIAIDHVVNHDRQLMAHRKKIHDFKPE